MKQLICLVFFLAILSGGLMLNAQVKVIELSVDQTGLEQCINIIIEKPQEDLLKLFPNPNDGDFTLKIAPSLAGQITSVDLIDKMGRIIQKKDVSDLIPLQNITISMEDLATGVYFLKVNAGKQVHTRKFVIQNPK